MAFDEQCAGLDDVFGLGVEQSDGADVFLQSLGAEGKYRGRRAGDRKQARSGFIDPLVGSLRRESHRDQQLEWRAIVEFGLGVRVVGL